MVSNKIQVDQLNSKSSHTIQWNDQMCNLGQSVEQ